MLAQFPDFNYLDPVELQARLRKLLPPEHFRAAEVVSSEAVKTNRKVYLVGGIVRDLILGRPNLDLDYVCLENAPAFASYLEAAFKALTEIAAVKITLHPEFKTARLDLTFQNGLNLHLDLATARSETYSQPAALPEVDPAPATLQQDLKRRDFTINAMCLSPVEGLLDPFQGLEDLREGLVRVLHSRSFVDDPTRIIRGIRFAARFGYKLEPGTLALLEAAIEAGYLNLLSAERKRNELRLVLNEIRPEKGLELLKTLAVLETIHPYLEWNSTLGESFGYLRQFWPGPPGWNLFLAALLHQTAPAKTEQILAGLRFSGDESRVPSALSHLWNLVRPELLPGIKNSRLYALLYPFNNPPENLLCFEALLSFSEPEKAALVKFYRHELCDLKPLTRGEFLILNLGLKPGPRFRELLEALHRAVLDREIQGREAEEEFLRQRALN